MTTQAPPGHPIFKIPTLREEFSSNRHHLSVNLFIYQESIKESTGEQKVVWLNRLVKKLEEERRLIVEFRAALARGIVHGHKKMNQITTMEIMFMDEEQRIVEEKLAGAIEQMRGLGELAAAMAEMAQEMIDMKQKYESEHQDKPENENENEDEGEEEWWSTVLWIATG